jgi:tetratricopeptide (TPR) repeat protein
MRFWRYGLVSLFLCFSAIQAAEPGRFNSLEADSPQMVLFRAHLRKVAELGLKDHVNPSIFVSYSWDSETHKKRVLTFCEDLARAGIPVGQILLDEWANRPGGPYDLHQFMDRIPDSDKVILFGTSELKRKYEGSGEGVVSREITLLRTRIEKQGVLGVINAWFSGEFEEAFPRGLQAIIARRLDDYSAQFFEFLFDIYQDHYRSPHNPIMDIRNKFIFRRERIRTSFDSTELKSVGGFFPQSLKTYNAFLDRTDENGLSYLDRIFEELFMNEDAATHFSTMTLCASGMGGVGKTTLASEFAHKYKPFYDFIYLMDGGSRGEFLRSCISLLDVLGVAIPQRGNEEEEVYYSNTIRLINENLPRVRRHSLLIVDNVEDPGLISNLMPAEGHILYTSRNSDWLNKIDVDVLKRKESIQLLLQLTGLSPDFSEQAGILAEELGDLPLALAQAAAYIKQQRLNTFAAYLDHYRISQTELLAKKQIQSSLNKREAIVMTTWNTTMNRVSQQAQQLMSYLAYLEGADIPTSLFASKRIENMEGSLDELARYSMVKRSPDCISIHRLVQTVIRHDEEGEKAGRSMQELISLFIEKEDEIRGYKNFYFPNVEKDTISKLKALVPHALQFTKYVWDSGMYVEGLMELYVRIASFLNRQYEPETAVSLLVNAKKIAEIHEKSKETFDWINKNLLNSYTQMGPQGRKKILELSFIGDPLTAAVIAHSAGDFVNAKRLGLEAIEVLKKEVERIGGMGHGEGYNLATAYKNVGHDCLQMGEFSEAFSHFSEAEALCWRLFGNKPNEDQAAILFGKARACAGLGDIQNALGLFEMALLTFNTLYPVGAEAPNVAACLMNYAVTLKAAMLTDEAITQLKRAIAIPSIKQYPQLLAQCQELLARYEAELRSVWDQ